MEGFQASLRDLITKAQKIHDILGETDVGRVRYLINLIDDWAERLNQGSPSDQQLVLIEMRNVVYNLRQQVE